MSPETMQTVSLWLVWMMAVDWALTLIVYLTAPFYRTALGRALMTACISLSLLFGIALWFHYWDGHELLKMYIAFGEYVLLAVASLLMLLAVIDIKWDALRKTRAWLAWRSARRSR